MRQLVDDPTRCVICEMSFAPGEIQIVAGDGTGQKFAHDSCHWRKETERFRSLLYKVQENLGLRACSKCGHLHMMHHICYECGHDDSVED